MKYSVKDYEVRIWYSAEDEGFVAQAVDLPGISAVAGSREGAAREIGVALELALKTYEEDGVEPPIPRNPAAVAMGLLGGRATTKAKVKAARENGRKGGRPKTGARTAKGIAVLAAEAKQSAYGPDQAR
jgi:predicted RNase H-like HicB family nuclease